MGVKTSIHLSQLPSQYQHYRLIPTVHGVMASVYLLDNAYVLKLFGKETTLTTIENEINLLSSIQNLPIPEVIDRCTIDNYQVLIYTQMQGESISQPTVHHIGEIGLFLKAFHAQSQNINISCKERFQKVKLKQLIDSTNNPSLMEHFHTIDLTLKSEGVIHGDLFPDNCKFKEDKLSGVYDFSDVCLGDFHFDLAVVAVGWCFEKDLLHKQKVQVLLKHYGSTMNSSAFTSYIRYALLYYATIRCIAGRNYPILLKRLENIS